MTTIFRTALLAGVVAASAVSVATAADRPLDSPTRSTRSASPSATTRQSDRDYAVLTEQNIFVKDRRSLRRGDRPSSDRNSNDPLREYRNQPEAFLVLTGVVFEDGDYRAFIEDTKVSKVLRLSVGDAIARGKITEIDIDTIAYESSGKTTIINVGTTLTGIPYSAFTATPGATPASTGAAPSTPLPDPNNPNLTIEEKMKLRRAAELAPKK